MRADGRAATELRRVRMIPEFVSTAPGAVLCEMGRTRVICTASFEDRVPSFRSGSGAGWLTAEYAMLPGSSRQRVARESSSGRPNGRAREIQRLIGRALRAAVDLEALGERTIYLDCDVIEADGGTRTASITGAYVALALAGKALVASGQLERTPVRAPVAAVSVGVVDDQVLLDLCYAEDVRAGTDMNVVMTTGGGMIEIQGTAEGAPFTRAQSDAMLSLAHNGIEQLLHVQEQVLQGVD